MQQTPCTFCRALIAARDGRYQDAISLLDIVLDTTPGHVPAHVHRGKLYALTGRSLDAVEEFHRVIGMDGQNWEAHLNLAAVFTLLGMYDDAADHLRFVGTGYCQRELEMLPDLMQWKN